MSHENIQLFDLDCQEEWLNVINTYSHHVLHDAIRADIAMKKPECFEENIDDWLPMGTADKFFESFISHYTHIRVHHGCKPLSVKSYFEKGVQISEKDKILDEFNEIYSDVDKNYREIALKTEIRDEGILWVHCSKYYLTERANHYMRHGSEILMVLARELERIVPGADYGSRLYSRGIPTVIEAHIPINRIPEKERIKTIVMRVLVTWGRHISKQELHFEPDIALRFKATIEPELIVGHFHPFDSSLQCDRCNST